MKASEALKQVQDAISEAERSGARELSVANLKAYLASVTQTVEQQEQNAPATSEAQANHQLEIWKARLSADSAMSMEMFKAAMEAGQTALRSAIVINGGAAVTVLAFAGNAITKGQILPGAPLLTAIGTALLWFMTGVGGAGVASGFRYLAQFTYAQSNLGRGNRWWRRSGTVFNVISILLGVGSFAVFFFGGLAAYRAIVVPAT